MFITFTLQKPPLACHIKPLTPNLFTSLPVFLILYLSDNNCYRLILVLMGGGYEDTYRNK